MVVKYQENKKSDQNFYLIGLSKLTDSLSVVHKANRRGCVFSC